MKGATFQLTELDRKRLRDFKSKGVHSAREVTRAHVLLALDAQVPIKTIRGVLGVSRMIIWRTEKAYQERGLDWAIHDAPRPGQPIKYGADAQAAAASLAAAQPPNGASRWTLEMLTQAARQQPPLQGINRESLRKLLKKAQPRTQNGVPGRTA